jgi:hypothetical protein
VHIIDRSQAAPKDRKRSGIVVQGTEIAPRGTDEKTGQALRRLTKAAARKLITALVGP